ncbi:hypothetical protein NUSPORA_02210 [Nucleospora cyclopteri]
MEIYLSSTKRGYGLKELLSQNLAEYWSSDSVLPHTITITFERLEYVYSVDLYLSYVEDESYTPEKICVFFNNKKEEYALCEPEGFTKLLVKAKTDKITVVIISNHTDGKDSHVRFINVMKSISEPIRCYNDLSFDEE